MLSIRNTHTHTHIVRHTCIEIEKDFWANDEVILLAALGSKSGLSRWSCGLCFGFSCGSYAGWLTDCRSVNITQAWELAGWLAGWQPWRRHARWRQIAAQTSNTHSAAMWAGDELAKNPVGSKIMNALTFEHLMCRNNDELVTRQKLLKRKIMRRSPPRPSSPNGLA